MGPPAKIFGVYDGVLLAVLEYGEVALLLEIEVESGRLLTVLGDKSALFEVGSKKRKLERGDVTFWQEAGDVRRSDGDRVQAFKETRLLDCHEGGLFIVKDARLLPLLEDGAIGEARPVDPTILSMKWLHSTPDGGVDGFTFSSGTLRTASGNDCLETEVEPDKVVSTPWGHGAQINERQLLFFEFPQRRDRVASCEWVDRQPTFEQLRPIEE